MNKGKLFFKKIPVKKIPVKKIISCLTAGILAGTFILAHEARASEEDTTRIFISSGVFSEAAEDKVNFSRTITSVSPSLLLCNGNFSETGNGDIPADIHEYSWDAVNLGISEFSRGQDFTGNLEDILSPSPLLNCNFTDKDGNFIYTPYTLRNIKSENGSELKVLITGAISEERIKSESPMLNILSLGEGYSKAVENSEEEGIHPDITILLYSGNSDEIPENFIFSHPELTAVITEDDYPLVLRSGGTLIMSPGKNNGHISSLNLTSYPGEDGNTVINVGYGNIAAEEYQVMPEESNAETEYETKSENTESDTDPDHIINSQDTVTENENGDSITSDVSEGQERNNISIDDSGVFKFTDDFETSFTEDSSLPDLLNIVQICHFLPENHENLPVVSVTNISGYLSSIKKGEYDRDYLKSFLGFSHTPYAVKIKGGFLKRIMEDSFRVYEKSGEEEDVCIKPETRVSDVDFYENILFTVCTARDEMKRLKDPCTEDSYGNLHPLTDDEDIILVLPHSKLEYITGNFPDEEMETVWKSPCTMAELIMNYINTMEERSVSPFTDHNWNTENTESTRLFSAMTERHSLMNLREIPDIPEGESPIGKFILDTLREESKSDITFIEKDFLGNGLKEGEINEEDISSLTRGDYGVVKTRIMGSEIEDILLNQVAANKSQVSGVDAVFTSEDGGEPVLLSAETGGESLDPDKEYSVSFVTEEKDPQKLSLNEILTDSVSKKDNIDYTFTPSVRFAQSNEKIAEGDIKFTTKPRKTSAQKTSDKKIQFSEEYSPTQKGTVSNTSGKSGKNLPDTGSEDSPPLYFSGLLILLTGITLILKRQNI